MAWIRSIGELRSRAGSGPSMKSSSGIVLACLEAVFVSACGSPADVLPSASGGEGRERVEDTLAGAEARWSAPSHAGLYRIMIRAEEGGVRLGRLHSWIVEVASRAGEPVRVAYLVFDGGMPQHGHGFETSPRVTDSLGQGVFRVDGVRFQMAGSWKIRVDVAGPEGADFVIFDVEIGP